MISVERCEHLSRRQRAVDTARSLDSKSSRVPALVIALLLAVAAGCSQGDDELLAPTTAVDAKADEKPASEPPKTAAATTIASLRKPAAVISETIESGAAVPESDAAAIISIPMQEMPPETGSEDEQEQRSTAGRTPTNDAVSPLAVPSDSSPDELGESEPLPQQTAVVAPLSPQGVAQFGGSTDVSQFGSYLYDDMQRPRPLHVDVDGDSAVIISRPEDEVQGAVGQRSEESFPRFSPTKGEMFIWHDGEQQVPVWQDIRLTVADIFTDDGWGDSTGPVFWSESDELMALPGGVVLILDPGWDASFVEAFMESNGIVPDDATAFAGLTNAFKVETAPGFPSLRTANSLAVQSGVVISSPNWWIRGLVE